jgi:enoyl-CoA hydratase/carnithine racemase
MASACLLPRCPQEAKELGLVLEVHPPEQLMAAAHALAGRIAAAAPAAVSATLQMLRLQLPQHVLQEAALLEAKEQAGMTSSWTAAYLLMVIC